MVIVWLVCFLCHVRVNKVPWLDVYFVLLQSWRGFAISRLRQQFFGLSVLINFFFFFLEIFCFGDLDLRALVEYLFCFI